MPGEEALESPLSTLAPIAIFPGALYRVKGSATLIRA